MENRAAWSITVVDVDATVDRPDGLEAKLAEHRRMRATALPDDDLTALDAEIARLERALEAMWRR